MMLLVFKVGEDRYGVDVNAIVEVTPSVPLQSIPQVPDYVVGLLNFRGKVVPVFDLSRLIAHSPARRCLSTRIMLVELKQMDGKMVGLLAEEATETIKVREEDISHTGIEGGTEAFVDGVVLNGEGMIRLIDPDKILSTEVKAFLAGDVKSPVAAMEGAGDDA